MPDGVSVNGYLGPAIKLGDGKYDGRVFRPGRNVHRGLLGQKNSLLPRFLKPPLSTKLLLVSTVKAWRAPWASRLMVYSARPSLTGMFGVHVNIDERLNPFSRTTGFGQVS